MHARVCVICMVLCSAGLIQTYEKYRKHGLEILGFPCNQVRNSLHVSTRTLLATWIGCSHVYAYCSYSGVY